MLCRGKLKWKSTSILASTSTFASTCGTRLEANGAGHTVHDARHPVKTINEKRPHLVLYSPLYALRLYASPCTQPSAASFVNTTEVKESYGWQRTPPASFNFSTIQGEGEGVGRVEGFKG